MPGGILIGDPQFKHPNLQMKIWGLGMSAVWFSVGESLYGDGRGWPVCDGGRSGLRR